MYGLAYVLQTDKLTDISYSATFAAIAAAGYYYSEHSLTDQLTLLMIILWALRLGGYLFYRIMKIGHDDRFDDIRTDPIKFFSFWIMQGLTCGIVSFAYLQVFQEADKDASGLFLVGITLALAGLLMETVADVQKFRFKKDHPKKFMNRGLWQHLRHPNYTGELLFWWGIFLASIPFANLFVALSSPLWISLIIIKFSGIPILEKKWEKNYGQSNDYQSYVDNSWRLVPYVY
jgi:steroid 5-alpha reductase family enzyme